MGCLQAKLARNTTVNPPASESEEDEESPQRSTPVQWTSSQQDNPQPSQSSIHIRAKSKSRADISLKRFDESIKLTERIEMMMEEVEDSRSTQSHYGVWLAQMVPQTDNSLIQEYYKQ